MDRQKWIGLAEVKPNADCCDLEQPAFVNVIGLAADQESFIDLIREACDCINVRLIRVDDVESWRDHIANHEPEDEVRSDVESVNDERPFVFGTFVCFRED